VVAPTSSSAFDEPSEPRIRRRLPPVGDAARVGHEPVRLVGRDEQVDPVPAAAQRDASISVATLVVAACLLITRTPPPRQARPGPPMHR
jgi:hypothetical protein